MINTLKYPDKKLIDLLEKQLIFSLYTNGVTRNDISKILSISNNKVSEVTKYLKKT